MDPTEPKKVQGMFENVVRPILICMTVLAVVIGLLFILGLFTPLGV